MDFHACELPDELGPFIETVFHFRGYAPEHAVERVVPTGHVFLIFELDGMVRNTFDNATLAPNGEFTRAWVSGIHRNFLSISAHEDSEMCGVQFAVGGAFAFLHRPVFELNDRVVAAEQVFGTEILELHKALLDGPTPDAKCAMALDWLCHRLDPSRAPPADLMAVVEALRATPFSNVARASADYPKTQKHLIEQFKRYVGPTPKYLQRILRFGSVLDQVHADEPIRWAELASECGFADQSHFIREFRLFSGFQPSEFVRKSHHTADPQNFFPVDDGPEDEG